MSTPRKAPCVDVRTDVHKDVRFEVLGELAGYNRYEALGRLHALWSWCVDRGLQDAPDGCDGYVVSDAVVRRFLGSNGVTAILGDGCDEFALGERRDDARIYLRGTSEYVADRRARAVVASAGGSARAASTRDQGGRFVVETTNVQPGHQPESSRAPAAEPAANQPSPASSSSSSPSDLQNTHSRARERHPAAGGIARRTWERGSVVRGQLTTSKLQMPPWGITVDADHPAWKALLDRICELLVNETPEEAERIAMNRIDVAAAKAKADGDGQWFAATAMFTANSFAHFARLTPDQVTRKPARTAPRTGAIGASTPHKSHGVEMKPAKEVM